MTGALHHVGAVHTAGSHLNQQLASLRLGIRSIHQTQNLRASKRGNFNSFHFFRAMKMSPDWHLGYQA